MKFARLCEIAMGQGGRFVVKRKGTKIYIGADEMDDKRLMDWYDYNRPSVNLIKDESINFIDSVKCDATLYFWS